MASVSKAAFWVPDGQTAVFHYLETYRPEPKLIALGCHDKLILEQRIERSRDGSFEILPITFGDKIFHLALNGFECLYDRDQNRSENSGASYLARRDLGGRGYLVQAVSANAKTSAHGHSQKTERFDPILGRPTLRLGTPTFKEGERKIKLHVSHLVPAGIWHQLLTSSQPALNMIEVVGPDALGMGDYVRE